MLFQQLKPITQYAIKHRGADHPVAGGVYETLAKAEKVMLTIPPGRYAFTGKACEGCGVGCRDEYEIVEIVSKATRPLVVRKLKVKSE